MCEAKMTKESSELTGESLTKEVDAFLDSDIEAMFAYYDSLETTNADSSHTPLHSRSHNVTSSSEIVLADSNHPHLSSGKSLNVRRSDLRDMDSSGLSSAGSLEMKMTGNIDQIDAATAISDSSQYKTGEFTIKKINIHEFPNESRMMYLLRFPQILQACLNIFDLQSLGTLFSHACDPHVSLKSAGLPPIIGIQYIVDYFALLFECIPDILLNLDKAVIDHRVITCMSKTIGTLLINNRSETIRICSQFNKENDINLLSIQQTYMRCRYRGKNMKFLFIGNMYFILNPTKTHIQKWIITHREIIADEVDEANTT